MKTGFLILFFCHFILFDSSCQIPIAKNKEFVRYDSMVSYFYGGDYDSLNSTKIYYFYDEGSGKTKQEKMYFWDQDKNSYYAAERKEYEYDEKGNTTLYLVYQWNFFINDWSGITKEEHFYSDTLNSQTIYEKWNEKRRDFDGSIKIDWYLRPDGSTAHTMISMWDTVAQKWYNQSDYIDEYSGSGLKLRETGLLYDTLSATWNFNIKSEWVYYRNNKDSINFFYSYNKDSSDWICTSKLEYIYSDTVRITNAYSKKPESGLWEFKAKYEDVWDKRGNHILNNNLNWDSSTSGWVGGYQLANTFDSLNRVTESTQSKWDVDENDWEAEYKEIHEFDNAGHRTHLNRYWWRDYGWELISTVDSVYNDKGNLIISTNGGFSNDQMFEYFYDNDDILVKYNSYIGPAPVRELWTKGFYYRTKVITDHDPEFENQISIYPNPSNNYIKITGIRTIATAEIYDLQGTVRYQKNITNNEQIPVEQLNHGMYLLKIKSPEGNITRKIIKR